MEREETPWGPLQAHGWTPRPSVPSCWRGSQGRSEWKALVEEAWRKKSER